MVAVLEDERPRAGCVGEELDEVGVVAEGEEELELVAEVLVLGALLEDLGGDGGALVRGLDYKGRRPSAAEVAPLRDV